MAKRKDDTAEVQPASNAEVQNGSSPELHVDVSQLSDVQLAHQQPEATQQRRRRRPPPVPPEPMQLDPEFINNPQRMQYALLLALLLRQKDGSATFTQKDMDHNDTDYNVLFARTLDGKGLEVTVVSSESGIIRSPEKEREAAKWRQRQEEEDIRTLTFQTLPPPPPSSDHPTYGDHPAAAMLRLQGMDPTLAGMAQPGANPNGGFALSQLPQEQPQPATVVQMPTPKASATADGSTPYHFPFQVGESPATAVGAAAPMNLGLIEQQLLAKDAEVQAQEQAAIERQERGQS